MAELETEREMSRSEVAAYLRTFAEKLEMGTPTSTTQSDRGLEMERESNKQSGDEPNEKNTREQINTTGEEPNDPRHRSESAVDYGDPGKITFIVGNESATINPPETVHFEMAIGSDSTLLDAATSETVEFVIHWNRDDVTNDDELSVQ